jgi:formate-dependent phosphoribosylglycinamide formyltransferase (GAR transformylase)
MSGMRNEMERLISTALHCNPRQFVFGTGATTTITFGYKFVGEPCVILSVVGAAGDTAAVVSKDVDGDGYYTGATITTTGTSVDWIAIGTGIGQ